MGVQMTKELGVYNEEEKVHSPTSPQRYRLLKKDPRSATAGIKRSPIQVECTPVALKQKVELKDVEKLEDVISEGMENKEDKENKSRVKVVTADIPKYLETDLDQTPDSTANPARTEHVKSVIELHDVRSPTFQISRTPILVECTPELFALHSQIESLSFCDVDTTEDDPSAVVSDDDETSHNKKSSIKNWLRACDSPLCPESPHQVARKQKELNVLRKQLFFTPNVKETTKPKARTPLGDIQAGQLLDSPQKLVRSKQWRNIQEERKRRGILDTENTPPSLPPLSQISSAPGKIVDRKRNKVNWDEENTMFI